MDKALNYLALARKAGRVELGEEPAGAAARAQKAAKQRAAQGQSDHLTRRPAPLLRFLRRILRWLIIPWRLTAPLPCGFLRLLLLSVKFLFHSNTPLLCFYAILYSELLNYY